MTGKENLKNQDNGSESTRENETYFSTGDK